MSLTLLALFALPIHLKFVLDPAGTQQFAKEWSKSSGLQWASAVVLMMLALLIFTTSTVSFAWNWNSLLSWIGAVIALKGVSYLSPTLVAWRMRFMQEERLPMYGFFGLLLSLAMVYIDTQLL